MKFVGVIFLVLKFIVFYFRFLEKLVVNKATLTTSLLRKILYFVPSNRLNQLFIFSKQNYIILTLTKEGVSRRVLRR